MREFNLDEFVHRLKTIQGLNLTQEQKTNMAISEVEHAMTQIELAQPADSAMEV